MSLSRPLRLPVPERSCAGCKQRFAPLPYTLSKCVGLCSICISFHFTGGISFIARHDGTWLPRQIVRLANLYPSASSFAHEQAIHMTFRREFFSCTLVLGVPLPTSELVTYLADPSSRVTPGDLINCDVLRDLHTRLCADRTYVLHYVYDGTHLLRATKYAQDSNVQLCFSVPSKECLQLEFFVDRDLLTAVDLNALKYLQILVEDYIRDEWRNWRLSPERSCLQAEIQSEDEKEEPEEQPDYQVRHWFVPGQLPLGVSTLDGILKGEVLDDLAQHAKFLERELTEPECLSINSKVSKKGFVKRTSFLVAGNGAAVKDIVKPLFRAGIVLPDPLNAVGINIYYRTQMDDKAQGRFSGRLMLLCLHRDCRLLIGVHNQHKSNAICSVPMPRGSITVIEDASNFAFCLEAQEESIVIMLGRV